MYETIQKLFSGKTAGLIISALVVALTLSAAGMSVAYAVSADSGPQSSDSFTLDGLDIAVGWAGQPMTLSNMYPGSRSIAAIDVSNRGGSGARYSIASQTAEDFLAAQLKMTVKANVTDCSASGFDADGETVYTSPLGHTTGTSVATDRALGSSETLCLMVTLPRSTGNEYQGKTTAVTLVFDANHE